MARKQKNQQLIKGTPTHRRTEDDYMGALLDTVSLEDWRGVVQGALDAAKQGDSAARAWLSAFLLGKPKHSAPAPLSVVVQQLTGDDALINRLARSIMNPILYPSSHRNDQWEQDIKDMVAAELAQKIPLAETCAKALPELDSEQLGEK
ncbi:MAG: hypothetical protein BWK76_02535 [Desulfobulbaceae bacterium A2]|nr:MAG: hypothetical protein BWK76_02535 [Desulfobulbaceae bacterium A2]